MSSQARQERPGAVDVGKITSRTPLKLEVAAKLAFPDGSMKSAGLRYEITRRRLAYETIAGRVYTTLADIEDMRKRCRLERIQSASGRVCTAGDVPPLGAPLVNRQRAENNPLLQPTSRALDSGPRELAGIKVTEVLETYLNDKTDTDSRDSGKKKRELEQAAARLVVYWSDKALAAINTRECKGYVKHRVAAGGGEGGARKDLEVLRAAINHHGHENLHYGNVSVWMPGRGAPRDRWLTRNEAARMLWAAWRYREVQTIHVGANKGQKVATDRRPLQHVARFLLLGFYTGTRSGSIASASKVRAPGKSFVDLEQGIYYRKPMGHKPTKKRQPSIPLPPRLLAHMRRWDRLGIAKHHFVEFNGRPVISVKKAFRTVVKLARIDTSNGAVTPHTLRHTAATWLMQRGVNMWAAAGYLGMTVEVLERVYGHHHPDYLAAAVEGITEKPVRRGLR